MEILIQSFLKERSLNVMKKHALDSLTIRYIAGLEKENKLQSHLIEEQQKMIEVLEKENSSLREHIAELIKSK